MSATVRELNQHFIDLWWESDTGLPDLGLLYTAGAQTQNEKQLGGFLDQVERTLSDPPRNREEVQAVQVRLGAGTPYSIPSALISSSISGQCTPCPSPMIS